MKCYNCITFYWFFFSYMQASEHNADSLKLLRLWNLDDSKASQGVLSLKLFYIPNMTNCLKSC